MNFSRLAMAAVAGYIVNMAYGFVVFSILMADQFTANTAIFRVPEEAPIVLGFLSSFVGAFVFAYIYAKGYEGTSPVQEGLRFGVLIGLLMVCESVVWNHVTIRHSGSFTAAMTIAVLLQYIVVGIVVGIVYRPATAAVRRPAAI